MTAMHIPEMEHRGTRFYCSNLDDEQQKWLIDRLGGQIEILADDGSKVRVRVRKVRLDKAILEEMWPK